MSPLVLELRAAPPQRIDLGALLPHRLARMTPAAIARLPLWLGNRETPLGELFQVSGDDPEHLVLRGECARLDRIGAGMETGRISVEGDGGWYLGQDMSGGEIRVQCNAGPFAGAGMAGGALHIAGDADDFLGGALPGARQGMRGGQILVKGDCGDRAGDRLRRGQILITGDAGGYCGSRMLAGTLAVLGHTGECAGYGMRRGTLLLAQAPASLPATFNDSGRVEPTFLRLLYRALRRTDPAFERLDPAACRVQRHVGDLACQGQGEILIPV
jgi:formylmethanofuran dehydrogenase subunit C